MDCSLREGGKYVWERHSYYLGPEPRVLSLQGGHDMEWEDGNGLNEKGTAKRRVKEGGN